MKKLNLTLSFICVSLFMVVNSFAANSWDTCALKEVGVSGSTTQMLRVDQCGTSSNNNKYFLVTLQPDTTMATALTALSLSKKVKIYANFAGANTSSPVVSIQTLNLAQ